MRHCPTMPKHFAVHYTEIAPGKETLRELLLTRNANNRWCYLANCAREQIASATLPIALAVLVTGCVRNVRKPPRW